MAKRRGGREDRSVRRPGDWRVRDASSNRVPRAARPSRRRVRARRRRSTQRDRRVACRSSPAARWAGAKAGGAGRGGPSDPPPDAGGEQDSPATSAANRHRHRPRRGDRTGRSRGAGREPGPWRVLDGDLVNANERSKQQNESYWVRGTASIKGSGMTRNLRQLAGGKNCLLADRKVVETVRDIVYL